MYQLDCSVSVHPTVAKGLHDGRYHYALNPNFRKNMEELKEAGIDKVELELGGSIYADVTEEITAQSAEILRETGLQCNSVHLPFGLDWIDFASPWEADRQEILKWTNKIIKMFEKDGTEIFVCHPGGKLSPDDPELGNRQLEKSASEIVELSQKTVCFENMVQGSHLRTLADLVEFAKNSPNANIVLDVNHLLHDTQEDVILTLKDRIKHLHISDYDFVYERHQMPGDGKIDWMKVIGALEKVGYQNSFTYEVALQKYGYTYKDVKANYDRLFDQYNSMCHN